MLLAEHYLSCLHDLHLQLFGLLSPLVLVCQSRSSILAKVSRCSCPRTLLDVSMACTNNSSWRSSCKRELSQPGMDLKLSVLVLLLLHRPPESEIVYTPAIATPQAPSHLDGLATLFEALPATDLEPTGRHSIPVPSVARKLRIIRSGVNQLQEPRKRQGVLDRWLNVSVVTVRPRENIPPAAPSEYANE